MNKRNSLTPPPCFIYSVDELTKTERMMKLQDLLRHIADNVENKRSWDGGLLIPIQYSTPNDLWLCHRSVELKPRTHVVNGFTVPAPEVEGLDKGDLYFISEASNVDWHHEYTWYKDNSDKRFLERGVVHLTKEAAVANAKAMLGIDPYSEGEE